MRSWLDWISKQSTNQFHWFHVCVGGPGWGSGAVGWVGWFKQSSNGMGVIKKSLHRWSPPLFTLRGHWARYRLGELEPQRLGSAPHSNLPTVSHNWFMQKIVCCCSWTPSGKSGKSLKHMSFHQKWIWSSFFECFRCRSTPFYFSEHFNTLIFMIWGISMCRNWASQLVCLSPASSAHFWICFFDRFKQSSA